jgi:glucose/arabinose dehydrogenase
MKKILFLFFFFSALLIAAAVFLTTRSHFRGSGPAFLPPPEDIAVLLEERRQGGNSTGFPLKLPPGFSISLFAKDLGSPRVLLRDPGGTLLTSITKDGKVIALPDEDGDGRADRTEEILEGLNRPHGMALRCRGEACELFVAESHRVAVYTYDAASRAARFIKKLADLPNGGNHFTRSLLFLPPPDEKILLVSVGSTCNVCREKDWRRAAILALNVETAELKPYAVGLRNSVFMALNPGTRKIWATEMGRDLLGDDIPPDEINIIEQGKSYGWPMCYGNNVRDTDFDKNTAVRDPCLDPFEIPSRIDIPAHSAPLGLAFIPKEGWPEEYAGNLWVAYHGSWNRSIPTGYKVVRYRLEGEEKPLDPLHDVISGWLTPEGALGRPVDILAQPGGIAYISDDKAGVIYRLAWKGDNSPEELIRVESPKKNEIVKSPLVIRGEARGKWFFEASFPVKLLDGDGTLLAGGVAEAEAEWMTENLVPFRAELSFASPRGGRGKIVLMRDNPSGLPDGDQSLEIEVRFR